MPKQNQIILTLLFDVKVIMKWMKFWGENHNFIPWNSSLFISFHTNQMNGHEINLLFIRFNIESILIQLICYFGINISLNHLLPCLLTWEKYNDTNSHCIIFVYCINNKSNCLKTVDPMTRRWLIVGSSSSHRVRVVDDIISQLSIPNQHCLKALVTHSSHEKRISEHFKARRIKREEDDKDPWWAKHRLSWLIERQFKRKHPACLRLITTIHRALVTRSGRMNSSSPTHASTTLYPMHYIHWLNTMSAQIYSMSK